MFFFIFHVQLNRDKNSVFMMAHPLSLSSSNQLQHGVDVDHLHQTLEGDYAIYSGDDEDSDPENGNEHRQLEQRLIGMVSTFP